MYPSLLPQNENLPKAPAIAVGGKVFGKDATFVDIEEGLKT